MANLIEMANVLEQEWRSYFTQLNEVEKKSILLMIKTFLQRHHTGDDNTTMEQYNREIDSALLEEKDGNYITQDEMEKKAEKW